MAAKLTNSSDESSMGSAVYFSSKVFTENLGGRKKGEELGRIRYGERQEERPTEPAELMEMCSTEGVR